MISLKQSTTMKEVNSGKNKKVCFTDVTKNSLRN